MKVVVWPLHAHPKLSDAVSRLDNVEAHIVSDVETLRAVVHGAKVVVISPGEYSSIVASILKDEKDLGLLQLTSTGYEQVEQYGISESVWVCNAGNAFSATVAEHAMALLLAIVRQIPKAVGLQSHRDWDRSIANELFSLDGRTMAVLGMGNIGNEIAKRAKAFGMHVIGISRSGRVSEFADENLRVDALQVALSRSDVIVLSIPLSKESRHIINKVTLAASKSGAVLINISRGGLVDQVDLIEALKSGRISAAGLDVTEPEPLPTESPLWKMSNVLISPHIAGQGNLRTRERVMDMVCRNIVAFRNGMPLENLVLPASKRSS